MQALDLVVHEVVDSICSGALMLAWIFLLFFGLLRVGW
jgi:hypothetical protein